MKNLVKIIVLSALVITRLNAQENIPALSDSMKWRKQFGFYLAPGAFLHEDFGSGLRMGFDKGFGLKSAAGLECTFIFLSSKYISNSEGVRIRAEYRYYLDENSSSDQSTYVGISAGLQQHNVSARTIMHDLSSPGSYYIIRQDYIRRSHFFRAGYGIRMLDGKFFLDCSAWAGLRWRDVDIKGLSESTEKRTGIAGSGGEAWLKTAMNLEEYVAPDISFSIRIGFYPGSRK